MQEFFKALQRIEEAIQIWQTKSNDKYSHIEKNEIEKVYKMLIEKQKWYDQAANRLNSLRLHEDPAVLCAQIKQEREVSDFYEQYLFVSNVRVTPSLIDALFELTKAVVPFFVTLFSESEGISGTNHDFGSDFLCIQNFRIDSNSICSSTLFNSKRDLYHAN